MLHPPASRPFPLARRGAALLSVVLTSGALAGEAAWVAADPRIDSDSGRALLNYPHDRHFDHLHMNLELDIPSMLTPNLTGVETLDVAPIGCPRSELVLDCRGPEVQSVTLAGSDRPFKLESGQLRIDLGRDVPPGEPIRIQIRYTLDFSKNKGEGLTWSKPIPGADSQTRANPQIHAQGEAELNSRWFPCHDFPNERLTTELIVTLEEGYEVVSNGHLVSTEPAGPGRVRVHWSQDKPHPNYLVTLAIAKFAVVDVGGPDSARPGLPMPVYVPWGNEKNVKDVFGYTPKMIAFFEQRFGVSYPWDQYAQVCVRDFSAGGMENTSATFLTVGTSNPAEPGDRDDLVSHELAHQWFGDYVTCNSWEHLWLNEGWASFAECLWNEHKAASMGDNPSAKRGRDAYLKSVLGYMRQMRLRSRSSLPSAIPMASKRYNDPDAVFTKPDDPYAKGASILHMLRERLGDDAFFAGTTNYLKAHALSTAESDDFRRALEAASGQSLQRFFAQWVYRPGVPRLKVDFDWSERDSRLEVAVEQTQTIDRLNPAFAFTLPIYVKFEDGSARWIGLPIDSREVKTAFELPSKPTHAAIDPNLEVLAAIDTRKPLAMWLDELRHGVTIASRLDAAYNLADWAAPEAWDALEVVALSDRDEDVRQAASDSLKAARRVHAAASPFPLTSRVDAIFGAPLSEDFAR